VATTERALEAEVAVIAGQDVEGYCRPFTRRQLYRTYQDGLGRVADGLMERRGRNDRERELRINTR
jgi:hypothetical protein